MTNGKQFHAPERTIQRSRGCWNCTHFNNAELAKQHYKSRTMQEKMALRARHIPALERLADNDASVRDLAQKTAGLMKRGFSEQDAQRIATADVQRELGQIVTQARREDARFQKFDQMMATGQIGICVTGHSPGDFIDCRYLCDHWDAAQGASVATEGQPLDKLPEEVREDIDSKAKKA
jgi:hypothetical protein